MGQTEAMRTPSIEAGTVGSDMNPQRHMEMESQGEEEKGRGGRCWCPASVSRHLPLTREGCLLSAPALCLRVFSLAVETLLAPAQGKPEVLES